MKIGSMLLMGYYFLLLFIDKPSLFVYLKQLGPCTHIVAKYNHGILDLPYLLKMPSTQKLLISMNQKKGILLSDNHPILIKPFNQVCVATGVIINVPSGILLLISSLSNPSIKKPIAASGIQDEGDLSELKVLLLNLTKQNIQISCHQPIAVARLDSVSELREVYYLGNLSELGISKSLRTTPSAYPVISCDVVW